MTKSTGSSGPLVLLAGIVIVAVFINAKCGGSAKGGSPKQVPGLAAGSTVDLRETRVGYASADAYDKLEKFNRADDTIGRTALLLGGEVFVLDAGTTVKVLDPIASVWKSLAEVRVQSGEHMGRALLVSRDALQR